MIQRRRLLAGAGLAAATLAAPSVLRAEPRTVKMGALRLVHSMPPYFYERFAPAGTAGFCWPFTTAYPPRPKRAGTSNEKIRSVYFRIVKPP